HFLWRLLSGALPTGATMKARHINQFFVCRRCCSTDESIEHLFFGCTYAQAVWRGSGIPVNRILDPTISVEDKIQIFFTMNADQNHRHFPIWILWRLWKCRNMLLYQCKFFDWNYCLRQAKRDAIEWYDVLIKVDSLHMHPRQHDRLLNTHSKWHRPDQGWIKCNYDGSYINATVKAKAGWIFRTTTGVYDGSGHGIGLCTSSALESELQAVCLALQHASIKEVVSILQGLSQNFAVLNWIREVKNWSRHFDNIKYSWISRRGNSCADILAKAPLPNDLSVYYYSYVPHFLIQPLYNDNI
ncbi:hypothetical protein CARUB_v10018434mg, partial [Capsella rubella]